ncbi:MAG: putative porin [Pseudomonadota bacterium]
MNIFYRLAVLCVLLSYATMASAVSDDEFAELKAQFLELSQRLSALEAENKRLREQSVTTLSELRGTRAELTDTRDDLAVVKEQKSSSDWTDRITLKGDFRYRYEEIKVEGEDRRDRNRIRARPELIAKLPQNVTVGFGLATGSNDPVSANQTLGGGNDSKQINLNLAYAKWYPIESLYLEAGKFKNPLLRPLGTGLLWDSDWTPEGLNVGWSNEYAFATGIVNWLESDSNARETDEVAWLVQAGLTFDFAVGELVTAAGYYHFPIKGNESYFRNRFFGNSFVEVNGVDVYEFDYDLVELSAVFKTRVFDQPLTFFADYVENQDPDDFNTGWLAGVQLGKADDRGKWQLAYQFEDLEADAAVGLLTDSNFAGGGTDGRGSRISGAYGINKQWKLAFTWFVDNEFGEKAFEDEGGALNYSRFIVDTLFKY